MHKYAVSTGLMLIWLTLSSNILRHTQTTWISRDWLGKRWLSNIAPHVNPICSFAPLLFVSQTSKELSSAAWNLQRHISTDETKSRSTLHMGPHLLQTQEVEKKGEISASVGRQDTEWWAFWTIYSVCVNGLKSLNINKPFVGSQLCVFCSSHDVLWRSLPPLSHTAYLWS